MLNEGAKQLEAPNKSSLNAGFPGLSEMTTVARPKAPGEGRFGPASWALVAYAGTALGRVFPLPPGEHTVGRSPDCAVPLLDDEVSRQHMRIRVTDEGWIEAEDLGSTNGVLVNGEVLRQKTSMGPGDRLVIGNHVLKLVALDPLERNFHETLLDLSTKDALTGLSNRGNTLGEFQNRFVLGARYGRPLSVVICDLDHFKTVNDTHGHSVGDLVLRTFGKLLQESMREADTAGRIGGEEFLMVLPETDLAGARLLAERLRVSVEAVEVPLPTGPLRFTCSMGIAEQSVGDLDAGRLLARADTALYQAKARGRNQVSE